MAFCPKCGGQMDTAGAVCQHCGFDFPKENGRRARRGLAYSPLANTALVIGKIVAAIACVVSVIGCLMSLLAGHLVDALIRGPIAFFLCLAMFVLFVRACDSTRN